MKNHLDFKSLQIFSKLFLLKAEEIGYFVISIGLLIGFALVVFDAFKTLFFVPSYKDFTQSSILILDKFLIALIFLEIFYTVQIALLEESAIKCVEPFLLVAITALIRRLLILSFEVSHSKELPVEKIKYALIELLEVGFLILLLLAGLIVLRKMRRG
ncbi:MAG: hypothetical protein OD816_000892 [Thermodesulfobacterium sp.]|uniref:Phosphate-starvation-inducible E n=1 Tax=Candidatus Thermodesulfobacterium syntrophicum TaxID=3060442 RepID=A0AAE3P0D7_9BACT|nr:hypothetical protein [Candidatus Thermodesulfobacterium syntrophicum]